MMASSMLTSDCKHQRLHKSPTRVKGLGLRIEGLGFRALGQPTGSAHRGVLDIIPFNPHGCSCKPSLINFHISLLRINTLYPSGMQYCSTYIMQDYHQSQGHSGEIELTKYGLGIRV